MQSANHHDRSPSHSAVELGRAEVERDSNSVEAHTNLAWGYYGGKDYEKALQAFDKALTLGDNNLDAHYGRGLTLRCLNRNVPARAAFERAIQLAYMLPDQVRGKMVARLAIGQINEMETGDWGLSGELWKRNG